jgi:hypothetical protein
MTNVDLPSNVFTLRQSEFRAIPGSPWIYWADEIIRRLFIDLPRLSDLTKIRQGLATADNFRFLRYWWEAGLSKISFNNKNAISAKVSGLQWFPYMKGGGIRKWFGNQWFIVNWKNDGKEIKNLFSPNGRLASRPQNTNFYFLEGITWSLVSTTNFGVRYLPPGFIFDVGGSCGFPVRELLLTTMAVMNSPWMNYALRLLNPTINFQIGDIARVPFKSPTTIQKKRFDRLVPQCIHLQQVESMRSENTFDFHAPLDWEKGPSQQLAASQRLNAIEGQIDEQVYALYEISPQDRQEIESELAGGMTIAEESEKFKTEEEDESEVETGVTRQSLTLAWISYSIGIILGRFQPGSPGELGCAIYRRSDFAIGSLPEPSEEEFNELVGEPSQFAYVDEQGGRHVFSREVEQALQKLALPDGIAVFDPNHPRDLPTLVSKALELMLGQVQAQEVIRQAAGGDLRKFLEKDFFTQHHIKQYRKRPVYWPIQSSKRSYGFVLFHEKIDRNTFYALQQEPYLPTKRRAVQLRLEELGKKVLTAQGAARKPIEKEMDELRQLAEELAQFAKDLDAITRGGYEPEADWIDDGVILRMAPLWSVIPLWKSEPKKYWEELAAGKYDWSRIAMKYWPERVKQACKKNKSYAIAHGHEEWYEGE